MTYLQIRNAQLFEEYILNSESILRRINASMHSKSNTSLPVILQEDRCVWAANDSIAILGTIEIPFAAGFAHVSRKPRRCFPCT